MDSLTPITTEDELYRRIQAAIKPAIWGYVRVSSDKQEDGQSPEVQCDEIRAYCADRFPGEPVILVQEAASAALPMFTVTLPGMKSTGPSTVAEAPRPLFSMLLVGLSDRPKSKLVAWKFDRLARVASEQEMFLSLFRRYEIEFHLAYAGERHLVEGGASADQDPVRHLMRQILACFAEYERRMIQLRMSMGTRKKKSKGGWIGGSIPYGYAVRAGELVVVPEKAPVVVAVFRYRQVYRYTYRQICELLAAQFGDETWYPMRIMRMLDNRELYAGKLYSSQRPDLKILPDTWEAAESIIEAASRYPKTLNEEAPSYGHPTES